MESKAIDNTIKILYSYGGKILPRHTDAKRRPHQSPLPPSFHFFLRHQFVRRKCSPVPVAYPISVRSGAAKGCMYTRQLDGSPRFLYRGVHWNNYCH
ncbi:hypothetical protein glysoja_006829 [Glycine soja]|nr:hypothetical protein glysoja_006829 [Glycine soja]